MNGTSKDTGRYIVNAVGFEDYYETLQLSPSADHDTVEKVYRMLAKRFHPDNPISGNSERFTQLKKAYEILTDPEKRAAYDVKHAEMKELQWQVFDQESASDSHESDKRIFQGILSLLYVARRQDVDRPGMGVMHLQNMLGCPTEHLDFHVWYLKEKGWLQRLENGQLAITASGVEKLAEGDLLLRSDRLLSENISSDKPGNGDGRPDTRGRFLNGDAI